MEKSDASFRMAGWERELCRWKVQRLKESLEHAK